jgi:hypothetical protein
VLGVSYEDLGASRRILLVPDASVVVGEAVLETLSRASYDPAREVLIEYRPRNLPSGSGGEAIIVPQSNPNRVVIETSSAGGGWLLLSDAWYPGWKAFIDGKRTDVFKANYLFMSVWAPEGEHMIEFRYRPTAFIYGAIVSGAAWLALIPIAIWRRMR